MASSIGIRVYLITVRKKHDIQKIPLNSSNLSFNVPALIDDFIDNNVGTNQDSTLERSWYFERKESNKKGNSRGYIHYGTFGFESNFVDTETQKQNYRRKVTDIEEIPLFYEFWFPEDNKHQGFAAFQSFQGRSCINLVLTKIKEKFEAKNGGYIISFRKLSPGDKNGNVFSKAPVKKLRLIKRNAPSDIADKYFGSDAGAVDFEVSVTARPKRSLGNLMAITKSLGNSTREVVIHQGVAFKEIIAEIRIGNRTRRIGVFGNEADAGVIDLTDHIKRGKDGHPDFKSITYEVEQILIDFKELLEKADT